VAKVPELLRKTGFRRAGQIKDLGRQRFDAQQIFNGGVEEFCYDSIWLSAMGAAE
jgi:hypothetical protein